MSANAVTAGRADYGELIQFRGLAPDEPFFMIRAQDAASGDTVRAWVMLANGLGAPLALLEQALRQADRLDAWPAKKVPDAEHLSLGEQQDLIYCLRRRAWNAREDVLDIRVFLAEQRAYGQMLAERRPLRQVIEALKAALIDEAREAMFEARRATGDADRDGAHRALGRSEGLARAHALVEELAKELV